MSDFELSDVEKDPAEERTIAVDLLALCAKFWEPSKPYSAASTVRPTSSTGFEYVATAGTSGSKEPRWPTVAGQTVIDGSVTWTAQAASTASLNVPTVPAVPVTPSGLTVAGISIADTTRILATFSGGTDGQDYEAAFTATINGNVRVRRVLVKVRKR